MEFEGYGRGMFSAINLDSDPRFLFATRRKGGARASAAARIYHGRSNLSTYCRTSVLLITGLWETGTSKDKRHGCGVAVREKNPVGDEEGIANVSNLEA